MVGLQALLVLVLLFIGLTIKRKLESRQAKQQEEPPPQQTRVEQKPVQSKQPVALPPNPLVETQSPRLQEKTQKKRKRRNKRVNIQEDPDSIATTVERPPPAPHTASTEHAVPNVPESIPRTNSQPRSRERVPLVPFATSIEHENHERLDQIANQILIISSTFPREFEELIPHSHKMSGLYRTTLSDEDRKVVLQWSYPYNSGAKLPAVQLMQVEGTKAFEQQIRTLVQAFDSSEQGLPVANLLIAINQAVTTRDNQDSSPSRHIQEPQPNTKTSHLGERLEQSAEVSAMNNTRRRQQYNELIDQIIFTPYLQGDFREAPVFDIDESKVSAVHNRPPDERSRYKSEFNEMRKLGEGGFGSVFLAKNLLDYNYNAVKKIRLNVADPFSRKVRKEVILLSSLNHPNIVRYYQSWIEEVADLEELCAELCIEGSEQREQLEEEYREYLNRSEDGEIYIGERSSEEHSEHDQDLGGISDISNHTSFFIREHNPLEQDITEKKSEQESSEKNEEHSHRSKSFPFRIMYIAMEYCDGNTLKDLIAQEFQGKKHDDTLEEFKIRILRGILEALVYLHDKKIIHRDLKPANIFLDMKRQRIKLGDFGLAANIEDGLAEKGLVGTIRYKAPQQGEHGEYTEKVDMYSLGIIMFEMFYCRKYGTESEREQMFKQLKQQKLPEDFDQYCRNPDIRQLLKNLVSRNSNQRPSARELLSKVKNKLFVQLVSAITNPNHFEFRSLLNSLFQIKNSHCEGTHRDSFRRYNYSEIETLFRCHGGNNIHVTPMIPVQDYLQLNRKRVLTKREKKLLMLSQDGGVFEMSSSSYQPWLKWIRDYLQKNIKNKPRCIRRYSFCEVYEHEGGEESMRHRQRIVGVFDVVADLNRQYLGKHQSQLIKLSVQAVNHEDCVVNISHSLLLKVLCEQVKFSEETLYKVLLDHHLERTIEPPVDRWQQAFKEHEIHDNISRRLIKFFRLTATHPKEFIELLQNQELQGANFNEILKQLETVDRLIQLMGVNLIAYRLMIPPEGTHGIFWKVTKNPQENRSCVSGFTTLEEYHRGEEIALLHVQVQLTVIPKSQVEVYVWSIGEVFEEEMVKLVNECWDNGIYADYSNECMGEKVEGVRVGLILRKAQKKLHVSIRKFALQQQTKVEWHALESFDMGMVKIALQER